MRKISLSYHHVLTADISLGVLGISVKTLSSFCVNHIEKCTEIFCKYKIFFKVDSDIKKLLKTYNIQIDFKIVQQSDHMLYCTLFHDRFEFFNYNLFTKQRTANCNIKFVL